LVLSSSRTRTPPPTLFPYTTLFRSDHVADLRLAEVLGEGGHAGREPLRGTAALDDVREELVGEGVHQAPVREVRRLRGEARGRGDRKSTRLNSSHVSISYAVFCLKK